MIETVLAIAVFVLAVAVVGLFAMMGELAARVPPAQAPEPAAPPEVFADARLGAEAAIWPAAIAHLRDADRAVLVVFSPVCTTCRRIASGETGPLVLPGAAGVVVSCPRESRGQEFLDEYPVLRDHPCALDPEGKWLTGSFGVDISPSVLVFEHGRLRSAHTFTTAEALAQLSEVHNHKEEDAHAEKHGATA